MVRPTSFNACTTYTAVRNNFFISETLFQVIRPSIDLNIVLFQTAIASFSILGLPSISKIPLQSPVSPLFNYLNHKIDHFMMEVLRYRSKTICISPPVSDTGGDDIDHTRTKARHPQTNGICEIFNKTIKDEFYSIAFRKKIYRTVEELQQDLNVWVDRYNNSRTHQGMRCLGRTPMNTFMENLPMAKEKRINREEVALVA